MWCNDIKIEYDICFKSREFIRAHKLINFIFLLTKASCFVTNVFAWTLVNHEKPRAHWNLSGR